MSRTPFVAAALAAVAAAAICGVSIFAAQAPPLPTPQDQNEILHHLGRRNIHVHDPSSIIKCKDQYWIFFTGSGPPSIHSSDMIHWFPGPHAFTSPLPWAINAIPGNTGMRFWAPDISRVGNRYMLFLSASTFGKNISAIGVATNPTLDPADPAYHWTDGGLVVQSREADDFNCIDPAACLDADGRLWLSFGSFWSGIKLIELNPATGLRVSPHSPMYSLARADAIEASYLYRHDLHYYLFVAWGLCCRGIHSTYNTRVGRADKITGPYLDKNGKDMLLGGGTLLAGTQGPMIGPGQAGIFQENGKYWFSCHFYDATANGASRLSIRPLMWSADGWPQLGMVD